MPAIRIHGVNKFITVEQILDFILAEWQKADP
jgi:hypothetical protein